MQKTPNIKLWYFDHTEAPVHNKKFSEVRLCTTLVPELKNIPHVPKNKKFPVLSRICHRIFSVLQRDQHRPDSPNGRYGERRYRTSFEYRLGRIKIPVSIGSRTNQTYLLNESTDLLRAFFMD